MSSRLRGAVVGHFPSLTDFSYLYLLADEDFDHAEWSRLRHLLALPHTPKVEKQADEAKVEKQAGTSEMCDTGKLRGDAFSSECGAVELPAGNDGGMEGSDSARDAGLESSTVTESRLRTPFFLA